MNTPRQMPRRSFLKSSSVVALTLPLLDFGFLGLVGCAESPARATYDNKGPAPWKISLVSDKEPGEPLIVTGTIYAPDGPTPMKGIDLFVYQTDATGVYTVSGGENRDTRINGRMTTGDDGRYEFRTIKPGSYPGSRNPAHIHAYVSGPGYPEYWIDEYWFEEDPFVTAEMRRRVTGEGRFRPILSLTRVDGVWRGERDIKLERCSRNCTGR